MHCLKIPHVSTGVPPMQSSSREKPDKECRKQRWPTGSSSGVSQKRSVEHFLLAFWALVINKHTPVFLLIHTYSGGCLRDTTKRANQRRLDQDEQG